MEPKYYQVALIDTRAQVLHKWAIEVAGDVGEIEARAVIRAEVMVFCKLLDRTLGEDTLYTVRNLLSLPKNVSVHYVMYRM